MQISDRPITWNQRLNAWDAETIEALQERMAFNPVIQSEIVTLFAKTMQWGKTHPFDPENTGPLIHCWTMLVLGCNIPWKEYDASRGKDFLPTLIASNPQGVLEYLQERVHARLKDRQQSAAWMAQTMHVARYLDAEKVAPVLQSLAKIWHGDSRRSQEFSKEVGTQALHFPVEHMHEIHAKFSAYPDIQKAILQWDGLCTAERVFQSSSIDKGPGSPEDVFQARGAESAFHAHTMALTMSGAHLRRRWGLPATAIEEAISGDGLSKARPVMEKTWSMLRHLADDEKAPHDYDRGLLQQVATLCMESVPEDRRVIRYEKADAVLLGDKPYYKDALNSYLKMHTANGERVNLLFLEVLTYADPTIRDEYRPLLSASAKEYLLDFMAKAGNAFIHAKDVPLMLSYLSANDIVPLAQSSDEDERRLFWRAIDMPDALNDAARRSMAQAPEVQKALLLATIMETHGVEHWDFHEDHEHTWAQTLPAWYPEHELLWEHVLREMLRSPKTGHDVLLNAVLEVQNIPRERWDVIKNLVGTPSKNKNPRQAMAQTRTWNLGLPQIAAELAWVTDAMHAKLDDNLSLVLPALDGAETLNAQQGAPASPP